MIINYQIRLTLPSLGKIDSRTMINNNPKYNILIAEDNPADVELFLEAFESTEENIASEIKAFSNGVDILNYLFDENSKIPDLILLDINMPKKNGKEVLTEIKSNTKLQSIPVIMLTTSDSFIDIKECYNNGANAYLSKTINFKTYIKTIESIQRFWLQTAQLPSQHPAQNNHP